ncbi:sulfite exporter TauE/SafE family protein [Proteobacteria bacterium 005FR1]|nr:sulfite exporter TauE/SafE family protein [Proteobacteria bacterium 005FR1]
MLTEILVYLAGGAFAGFTAGLFGVGGGTVLVPVLLFIFRRAGFPDPVLMHMAVATSHSVIIFNAISSMRAHHLRGAVNWLVFRGLAPGIIAGALFGAWLADQMASEALLLVFAIFLLIVSVQMLLGRQPRPHRTVPGPTGLAGAGSVIGGMSALVGIGGGSLTVPYLSWCNVAMASAVGTAAAIGLPISLASTLGFILAGWDNDQLPAYSVGFVYLPGLVGLAVAGVLCAPLGARLAHRLPAARLKQIFALFLMLVGIKLLGDV